MWSNEYEIRITFSFRLSIHSHPGAAGPAANNPSSQFLTEHVRLVSIKTSLGPAPKRPRPGEGTRATRCCAPCPAHAAPSEATHAAPSNVERTINAKEGITTITRVQSRQANEKSKPLQRTATTLRFRSLTRLPRVRRRPAPPCDRISGRSCVSQPECATGCRPACAP
jgi:hypothetical protein